MDLIEYSKAGNPVLYFPNGEAGDGRLAVEVFRIPGGVAVADSGWSEPMNPTHPFHVLEGELAEVADDVDPVLTWSVGPHTLRELVRGLDIQLDAWARWKASKFRRSRRQAAAAIRADLGVDVQEAA